MPHSPPIEIRPTHTLCFITRGDHVLMLKRRKPPNLGLWNGVGGKIELGESPLDACLREIREETGFRMLTATFGGILSWQHVGRGRGSVYLYTTPGPSTKPNACSEGILRWQPRNWIFSSQNVVANIHIFGPHLLSDENPREYHFRYRDGNITSHEFRPLPEYILG